MSFIEDDPHYQPKAETYGDDGGYCICYQGDLDFIIITEEEIKHYLQLIDDLKVKIAIDITLGDDGFRSEEVLAILKQEREAKDAKH